MAWQWELRGKTSTPPAYADGTLYVGEWRPDADTGHLHAVDATDGTVGFPSVASVGWTYRAEPRGVPARGVRSPTVAGDTVYVVHGGELAAVADDDGSRRWRLDTGFPLGQPAVVEAMYVCTNPIRDEDSHLLAVREP